MCESGGDSQITGSPPLLSDLDILCDMEHEGQSLNIVTLPLKEMSTLM